MRIGLFTDTYRPSVNGIVFVVDILREELTAAGHEVFVVCNAEKTLRRSAESDDHIIRFPTIKQVFFDDYDLSLFFPPRELSRIKELELDAIMFFTPSQIGLMGVYAAKKLDIPLIAQYSTDLYEYVEHYRTVAPGLAALAATLPFTFRMSREDLRRWVQTFRPSLQLTNWSKKTVESLVTLMHQKCDAVIVLSRKSLKQLKSWEGAEKCRFELIPTGVDALPQPADGDGPARFRHGIGLRSDDLVAMYVGRLGAEKNLDVIIPMMERLTEAEPRAKFVFVGDFEYRKNLEEMADASSAAANIIFTGRIPREELGAVYGAADVFVFPSLKDTQGLVLHEAAHAGLPIVMCDPDLSEVVKDGYNGLIVKDSPSEMARAVSLLFANPQMREEFCLNSRKLAAKFSQKRQTEKIIWLIESVVRSRRASAVPQDAED